MLRAAATALRAPRSLAAAAAVAAGGGSGSGSGIGSAAALQQQQHHNKARGFVVKRDGKREPFQFDKITARIEKLMWGGLDAHVDPAAITQGVVGGMAPGITTAEIDAEAASVAEQMSVEHPDFSTLAARILVSRLHKTTQKSFSAVCRELMGATHPKTGAPAPALAADFFAFVQANAAELDSKIIHDRDFDYDYFGFKTLCNKYLLTVAGRIVERPQHMLMRIACGIHCGDLEAALETYDLLSRRFFTHASPTMFNAGSPRPQMSSCFLNALKADSIKGVYGTLAQCADISQNAGGIGLAMHRLRAKGSYITGDGVADGIVPCLRNFNATARYVHQSAGKRKGAFAVYLAPWHADFPDFLELKKNTGAEESRARDLNYAAWVPDLFMQRVEANQSWSLFCPAEAPGLDAVFGERFRELYERYEAAGLARRTMPARKLWDQLLCAQTETGEPYMLYSDACYLKSNQQHSGPILSSNLCTEILEVSSPDEVAVCNLASLSLPAFVAADGKSFDFALMQRVAKVALRNLDRLIDRNYYPAPEARASNLRHRPVGIGVQGLADAFLLMRMPFDSPEAARLNLDIFEALYFAVCEASCELAERDGAYDSFAGSPMSQGKFQFDLWGAQPHSDRHDWAALRARICRTLAPGERGGQRNSLMVALMPTASTSQILGNNECFEPYTSNLYVRSTLAGSFKCINRHLVRDLVALGLWTPELRNKLLAHDGSVQRIDEVPAHLKLLYRTAFELGNKVTVDLSADRAIYICHSQSLNAHMTDVTPNKLSSMHFYAWKKGLKTGMYYLRTLSAADAIKFTVDVEMLARSTPGSAAADHSAPAALSSVDEKVAPNDEAYAEDEDDAERKTQDPIATPPRKRGRDSAREIAATTKWRKRAAPLVPRDIFHDAAAAPFLAVAGKRAREARPEETGASERREVREPTSEEEEEDEYDARSHGAAKRGKTRARADDGDDGTAAPPRSHAPILVANDDGAGKAPASSIDTVVGEIPQRSPLPSPLLASVGLTDEQIAQALLARKKIENARSAAAELQRLEPMTACSRFGSSGCDSCGA